ncbi:hypothetical protein R6Q59_019032 [Mikania micrantha]
MGFFSFCHLFKPKNQGFELSIIVTNFQDIGGVRRLGESSINHSNHIRDSQINVRSIQNADARLKSLLSYLGEQLARLSVSHGFSCSWMQTLLDLRIFSCLYV